MAFSVNQQVRVTSMNPRPRTPDEGYGLRSDTATITAIQDIPGGNQYVWLTFEGSPRVICTGSGPLAHQNFKVEAV